MHRALRGPRHRPDLRGGALPPDLLGSFPYVERDGIFAPSAAYRVLQALTASVCILVPCFFMGATFPLLCDAFAHTKAAERFPSRLYAVNTLGACSGVLAASSCCSPRFGHDRILLAMAVANAALGLLFLLRPAAAGTQPQRPPDAATASPAPTGLLALVALGGLVAGALEGDLFKRITFVIELNPGATMSSSPSGRSWASSSPAPPCIGCRDWDSAACGSPSSPPRSTPCSSGPRSTACATSSNGP